MADSVDSAEAFESFSVKLEGYDVALSITIDSDLTFGERSNFMKEVINNYLFAMKSQGLISEKDDDIIIIDENDWDILRNHDSVLLESERKIILGFSGYNIQRSKYDEKTEQLMTLNKELFNKSYEKVEHSLSMIRQEPSFQKQGSGDFKRLRSGELGDDNNFVGRRSSKLGSRGNSMLGDKDRRKNETPDRGNLDIILSGIEYSQPPVEQTKEYGLNTGSLCQEPEVQGQLNDFWWSNQRPSWGSLSNMYGDPGHMSGMIPGVVPPLTMPNERWLTPKSFIYPECVTKKNLDLEPNGDWISPCPQVKQDYKGVIPESLKQLAVSFFTGRGMVGLQLPIRIFRPDGTLQVIAELFCGYPIWLDRANATTDPNERMKFVICGMIAGLNLGIAVRKPFHPHVGETFSFSLADGTNIYVEQVSFDPPVTAWLGVKEGHWRFYGRWLHVLNLSTNSFQIDYSGPLTFEFRDKTVIQAFFPAFSSGGVMVGQRNLYFESKACFYYKEFGLKGYLHFGKVQKRPASLVYTEELMRDRKDGFRGKIWKVNPKKLKEIPNNKKDIRDNFKDVRDYFNEKDLEQGVSTFCGSYQEGVEFDGKEYWNIKTHPPPQEAHWEMNPLPSDTRFREDLIWLYYGDRQLGAKWKNEMERVNRRDRETRKTGLEAWKKEQKKKK